MLLGIAESVAATWLGRAIGWYQEGQSAGFIMSLVGAVLLLAIYHVVRRCPALIRIRLSTVNAGAALACMGSCRWLAGRSYRLPFHPTVNRHFTSNPVVGVIAC